MSESHGRRLREHVASHAMTRFLGVYDVYSAALVASRFEGIFVSGFGLAASTYGLPDIGFITWTDMLDFVGRVRMVVPETMVLVDVDDGYVDTDTAVLVTRRLERIGASGIVLEDQQRPRRLVWTAGAVLLEAWSRLLGTWDLLVRRKNPVVWDVARTTKKLD